MSRETTPRAVPRPGEHYDVVVVGWRVAGAATAMLLARSGHRVLMIDRARHGSDTVSTHTLLRSGVLQLKRWGLLDRVVESGAPPIPRVTLGFGDELVPIDLSDDFGVNALYAPRRTVLDPILVEAACQAGVDFVDRCSARSLRFDERGRVEGVDLSLGGSEISVSTRFVVGADGVHSRVAGWVGAKTYRYHPPSNSVQYAYYEGIEVDGVHFQFTPGVTAGLIPTNDGLVCVYGGWPSTADLGFHDDPQKAFTRAVSSSHPDVAARVQGGIRVSAFRGTRGLPSYLRRAAGPGWALVGDAGYMKDPVSAHGLSAAMRDAESCARAIHEAIENPGSERELLDSYWRGRDELSLGHLEATVELAGYRWDPSRASSLMRYLSDAVQDECHALEMGHQLAASAS